MSEEFSRRSFLQKVCIGAVSLSAAGALLTACEKGEGGDGAASGGGSGELDCTDTSGLTETEKATRKALAYVDDSPKPGKYCDNCSYWQPPADGNGCGGCTIIKGPIHPKGYCNSWVEQKA